MELEATRSLIVEREEELAAALDCLPEKETPKTAQLDDLAPATPRNQDEPDLTSSYLMQPRAAVADDVSVVDDILRQSQISGSLSSSIGGWSFCVRDRRMI